MAKPGLTVEQRAVARARYEAGETAAEIAAGLGFDKTTVARTLRRMGVPPRPAVPRPGPRPYRRKHDGCQEPGCGRPHHARGFCHPHWKARYEKPPAERCAEAACGRPRKYGSVYCGRHRARLERTGTTAPTKFCDAPIRERWERHVEKGPDCWLWTGPRSDAGYGSLGAKRDGRGRLLAHRLAYELFIGPVPDGLNVLHSCDNPPCVNPAHLRAGTQSDNSRDVVERGRRKHWRGRIVSDRQVRDAFVCAEAGESPADLARELGITSQYLRGLFRRVRRGTFGGSRR